MSTRMRLAGFVAAAVLVFLAAVLTGRASDLDLRPTAGATHAMRAMDAGAELPGGLASDQDGYALSLASATAQPGRAVPLEFRILGKNGRAVTAFDVRHDKQLHLIAVRRDFAGFQHVHPTLSHGLWRTTLSLAPGAWRVIADFAPKGHDSLALGADLLVPGLFTPTTQPVSRVSDQDGYRTTLTGDLVAGAASTLTLSVSRAGVPVTDLQPYLDAYGHLVALRAGDLSYLHVHPLGVSAGAGPEVAFIVDAPSAGTYHLFFDVKHQGQVHTASFVVSAR